MVIPKGKKFQFRNYKADLIKSSNDLLKGFDTATESGVGTLVIPEYGYLGLATVSQDMALGATATYSKPLEGILNIFPNTFDLLFQGKAGFSLSSSRFTNMKFWTGTESPEITMQVKFETQVDSYYDVYKPSRELLKLILPEENALGFYEPPVPTLKLIAAEAQTFFTGVRDSLSGFLTKNIPSKDSTPEQKQKIAEVNEQGKVIDKQLGVTGGILKDFAKVNPGKGYITDLIVGNNFKFRNIILKSVQPRYSSELAYAPLLFMNFDTESNWKNNVTSGVGELINGKFPMDPSFMNHISKRVPPLNLPNVMGESKTKAMVQQVCSVLAGADTLIDALNPIKKIPGIGNSISSWLEDKLSKSKIKNLPAFPLSAEVDITFEMQYPLIRNQRRKDELSAGNSIDDIFTRQGNLSTY